MKALIVDNESPIREGLRRMLGAYCPVITQVEEASGVTEARERIAKSSPDILFVDIEMDDGTGLELVRGLGEIKFQVVFITAFNQYAVDAFRLSAVDYLLKPVIPEDLVAAVAKASRNLDLRSQATTLQVLMERMDASHTGDRRIALRDHNAVHLVRPQDLLYCEAEGVYTSFVMQGGKRMVISKSLKEYEELLGSMGFLRVHHSYVVNMGRVSAYRKGDGGSLLMEDGVEIPVSQRKRDAVMTYLKQF